MSIRLVSLSSAVIKHYLTGRYSLSGKITGSLLWSTDAARAKKFRSTSEAKKYLEGGQHSGVGIDYEIVK